MTDNKMEEELYDEDEVNIGEILLVLWRHIGAIIFATLIAGIIAILGTVFLIKPTYKSTFSAYINNRSQTDQNDVAALNSGDTTAAIQLTNTYAAILTSRPLVEQAVKKTKTDIRYEDVAGFLSTNVENNTSIITVNVVTAGSITPDPTWLLESEQMDKQKITTIKNAKVFSVVDIARPAGITDE